MPKIGIVILATNAYFVLGIRFIKRFMHHYKGNASIKFYFFSDEDPSSYLPDDIDVEYHNDAHTSWVDATNSKFKNILLLLPTTDYLYYFDADTNVTKDFTEEWFLGDLIGGEHYGNRSWLANGAGFERNLESKAYVPHDSILPYTYHYGAFFGGKTDIVKRFCQTLKEWQLEDKKIGYEPGVNDESYINAYFHFYPPTYTVPCEKFMFDVSDKGNIGETRNTSLNVSDLKKQMLENKNNVFNIQDNKIII